MVGRDEAVLCAAPRATDRTGRRCISCVTLRFFRVHRTAIVRFDLIEGLTRTASGDYTAQLRGGRSLKVSRSRSEALEQRMGMGKELAASQHSWER